MLVPLFFSGSFCHWNSNSLRPKFWVSYCMTSEVRLRGSCRPRRREAEKRGLDSPMRYLGPFSKNQDRPAFGDGAGRPPRPAALPAEAPTRPRAASSALRALLREVCRAEAWDAAARGTVAESRVIARAARPLDAPARFQGHRTLWKLRGDLALHLNEESWSVPKPRTVRSTPAAEAGGGPAVRAPPQSCPQRTWEGVMGARPQS